MTGMTPMWPEEPTQQRLNMCLAMLYIHNCVTESQKDQIKKKIAATKKKAARKRPRLRRPEAG